MAKPANGEAALIVGAGNFLGAAIAKRFAMEGYHAVVTRRRGDLDSIVADIEAAGGAVTARHSDARDEDQVIELIEQTEADIGPIGVCVFNVGGNVKFDLHDTTARVYRKVWEMAAFAGFLVAREATRKMLERGSGTMLFTGATAGMRGAPGYSAFAGGKHALRALAQSTARELGPKGIHVGHIVIDGVIDTQYTRERFGEFFEKAPPDGYMKPEDLAELYWQMHCQPRAAWTFEMDVRPYCEHW